MLRRVLVVGIVLVALTAMTGGSGGAVEPTVIPANASASWLHSTLANEADRAKGWHPCEHDCNSRSCDKICHYR
jgi:H+/Cl- antiporter ClcA